MIFKLLITLFLISHIKAQTTTVPAVAPCPASYSTYCKNSGFCVVLFGTQLSCTCPVGFTGKTNQN